MNIAGVNTELLPIVIQGHTFNAGIDGRWSLNEIHKTLGLVESKRPSEWNNAVSAELTGFRKFPEGG